MSVNYPQESHILRVVETCPHEQLSQAAVEFAFPSALLPQAVLTHVRSDHYLIVLSAGGVLYSVHLPDSSRSKPGASVLYGSPEVFTLSLHVSLSLILNCKAL